MINKFSTPRTLLFRAIVALSAFHAILLSGCHRYDVRINNQVVYSPPSLFKEFELSDTILRSCVEAQIRESKITSAKQLKQLACPPGEITNLSGLEVFTELTHLNLRQNQIADISPIGGLQKLRFIDLSGNRLVNVGALLGLGDLQLLNLTDNPSLDCQVLAITSPPTLEVQRPEHCQ